MTEGRPRRSCSQRWFQRVVGAAALAIGWPRPAVAVEYEIFIDVDDEDDLNDLLLTQQIDDTTHETLVELMRQGTDLDDASREGLYALPNLTYEDVDRILAYRAEAGRIADPADLVVAGVLSRRKLASLAAFLLVPDADRPRQAVHGLVRYRTTYVAQDPRVPPMALQARVEALSSLTVGAAGLLDPRRLGGVRWDPNRDALIADPDAPRPVLPKAFAQWNTDRWGIIAGTYRIGFGERLTFDDSRRYTPNGFYLDDAVIARYDVVRLCSESQGELTEPPCDDADPRGAPSYQVSQGLRGVAAGARHLELPVGWMQIYGFWSMQNHDLYQYRVYDRAECPNADPNDFQCGSPTVYEAPQDPAAATSAYQGRTLPNMVDIVTQGTNVAWFHDERTHVGVTGYGSVPRWRVEGAELDFAPSARMPGGGPFGAVGADFAWGYRWADLFGEVSRSFDAIPADQDGGGGFAGILRHTATFGVHELEVSARYYDRRYANPYSRPISARDRYRGNQARDEAGGRIRYNATLARRVDLRTFADVWVRPSTRVPQLRAYAHADVDATPWWRPGLWVEYQSQDLATGRFLPCTDSTSILDLLMDESTDILCSGQRVQLVARSRFQPIDRLSFTLQYRHDFQNRLYADLDYSRGIEFDEQVPSRSVNLDVPTTDEIFD
ncbi:MAG: hypothetical protein KDK70_12245, partial [Myxococcales bacterium]|nr:hypothetical protein [Myxococcales bacterium]